RSRCSTTGNRSTWHVMASRRPPSDGGSARLFFAAWPEPGIQQALHELARRAQGECGGRAIAARKIHLTLAFLGSFERARLDALEALAAGIAGAPCDLVLTRV